MIARGLILFLLAVLLQSAAHAQAEFLPEQPGLTVNLVPEEAHTSKGTYVHAQLRMSLRLRGRYAFEALSVTLPDIPDAEVIEIQRPRTRFVRSYAGAGYVYDASYAIYPQRSGVLEIPPVRAVGRVTTNAGEDLEFDLSTDGFTVQVDPAVEGFSGKRWFVADEVEISEEWSVPPDAISVGEVVRHVVDVRARGTTGDRMPELEAPRAAGVTIVDAGREVRTEFSGDGTVGHLRQSWAVRMDQDTVGEIAPVRVVFWNARQHAEDIAWLPVRRIEPLPADAAAIAAGIMNQVRADHQLQRVLWIELLAVLAAPFLLIALMYVHALLPSVRDLRLRWTLGRTSSAKEALEAVHAWLGVNGRASLKDPDLLNEFRTLDAVIFSARQEPFDRTRLGSACLRHARSERVSRFLRRLQRMLESVVGRSVELDQKSAQNQ